MGLLETLEVKNAFMFLLNGCIALAFVRMLITDRTHWGEPYYGAMIGVTVYFAAGAADQSWYWVWRHFGYSNRNLLIFYDSFMVIGAACLLRNFTVARFGHKLWIGIMVGSFAVAIFLSVFLPRGVEEILSYFS
jgi:hypothetical protein